MRTHPFRIQLLILCAALAASSVAKAADKASYKVHMQPLPGATPAGILMDYIAFDPATRFLWAPAGNTGLVAVIDTTSGNVKQISGFPTAEMGSGERKRTVGPSSVAVGNGTVYVGNRADSSVCAFEAKTLAKGACHKLDSMPDGLAYVSTGDELWVTTPRDKSIRVLNGKTFDEKAKLTFEGNPEGFAFDANGMRSLTAAEA